MTWGSAHWDITPIAGSGVEPFAEIEFGAFMP